MSRTLSPAHLLRALAAVLLLCGAATPEAIAQAGFGPCKVQRGFQCGKVSVPLDRAGNVPGTISLNVVRGTRATPASTAVVALAGGPGQAAAPLAPQFAVVLKPAVTSRDMLVFDQRGTGASNPLQCSAFERRDATSIIRESQQCAGQLGPGRRFFTTNDSALDVEALRVAFGYEKLTIYGVSYGTKVALAYAALFPSRVERLVLDSVVTPEGPDPLQRSTFAAIPRVLNELCSNGECRGITTNPVRDLRALVRKMQSSDVVARIVNGRGQTLRASFGRQELFDVLLAGDLDPTLRAELPGALAAARHGDVAPIGRLVGRANGVTYRQALESNASYATLNAATTCEELPFPWVREANPDTRISQLRSAVANLAPSTFFPFDRVTAAESSLIGRCLGWPAQTPAPMINGTLPAVPTLILNGNGDLRTPLEDARAVARRITGAQTVGVPFAGHSVLGGEKCTDRAVAEFFRDEAVSSCTTADNSFSPTPRAPATLRSIKPLSGTRGRLGRTIAAAAATATDMRRQLIGVTLSTGESPRGIGGLRGGRSIVNGVSGTQRLVGVRYINGVRVSGTVSLSGAANLRIGGGGALSGRVRISTRGAVIRGTLGGRSFRLVDGDAASTRPTDRITLAQARAFYALSRAAR